MKYTWLLISFTIILGCMACNQSKSSEPFKNVIVLVGDDHSVKAVGCYGNDIIRTPNIDRIAENGIRFANAYSNAPVCSASRQSVLTGKYPHATGVTLLQTPFRDDINITLAEHLRKHGFSTAIIGKTHFNNYRDSIIPDHGFSVMVGHDEYNKWRNENPGKPIPDSIDVLPEWKPFRDPARIWLNADMLPSPYFEDEGYAAWDAAKAIEFLRNNQDNRFLLWVGFHEPHSPFNFPIEYRGKYNPEEMPLLKGSPEDNRWIPAIFSDLSDNDKRGIIASYYTSVEYMDHNIGRILDEVERLDLNDNTLIVYIGDQGYLLGDHKRFEKHTMWELAIRSPLVMQTGDKFGKGKVREALVEFIDLAPTIVELLGLDPMDGAQGVSLVPVIEGEKEEVNDYVFAEFLEDNKAMICNKEWKYIFTTGQRDLGQGYATGYGPSGILHKLYNLKEDPEETHNVAGDPGNAEILERLQHEMIRIFRETHPDAGALPERLSIEETLIWFCEPRDVGASPGAF
jgi:arylsulfatase A-like enzyme